MRPASLPAVPWYSAPLMWPEVYRRLKPTKTTVGADLDSLSSLSKSAGCTVCEALQGSEAARSETCDTKKSEQANATKIAREVVRARVRRIIPEASADRS